MSKPSTMYKLKPIFKIPRKLELPDCMYKLNNPVACVTNTIEKENESEVLASVMDKEPLPELAALEARWDALLQELSGLKFQMAEIKKSVSDACRLTGYPLVDSTTLNKLKMLQGAVINASPSNPPYSLLLVKHLYKSSVPIHFTNHTHSSVLSLPEHLKCFDSSENNSSNNSLKLHIIWKSDLLDTELVMNPIKLLPLKGEVNILRLLARSGLTELKYPSDDILKTSLVDSALDVCHRLVHSEVSKEKSALCKNLNGKLGRFTYFGGDDINVVDVAAWSTLKQVYDNVGQDLSPNLTKWYQKVDRILF